MKGTLIKQHRKLNKMTLEELSEGICSVSYLSKIEHNSISASDEIYSLLEKRLNIKLIDINEEFDEGVYQDLLDWHEAAQLQNEDLMKQYDNQYKNGISNNQNNELNNLYKIIKARHDMRIDFKPLSEPLLHDLTNIYDFSNKEYKFFFHKTLGIHYLLCNDLQAALDHFKKTLSFLKFIHFRDTETYFHLCMAYSRLVTHAVESNYYGQLALEGYFKDLNYSRIIDTYLIIAINYEYLRSYDIAEEYYLKILKVSDEQEDPESKRRILENIGFGCLKKKEYEKSKYYLEQAHEIPTPDVDFEVNTIYLLASSHYRLENMKECWELIHKGESLAEKNELTFHLHKFYVLRNVIENTTSTDAFLKKFEQEVLPHIKKIENHRRYREYLEMLGDIYYDKRMYKKASSCYKEANRFSESRQEDLL
ncbi:helix-turn-helix transcriptional regulator [Halobacillus litoralis]|uniref:helix-turn-helix domain-containing protein n=1 Tax=Halobacillus litoralis TaxID=45668 RepID=UPI001CD488EC|nr:helix-turn-helix transcriptional regulator [Halobacillus litoralis]MCA0971204.1 helix-turn-helix transcriptional regulator [Halobacillus litoralis]